MTVERMANTEMVERIAKLEPLLEQVSVVGYAAARNTRALRDASADFIEMQERLICELGEPETDEEGNETGNMRLAFDSPNFAAFVDEMGKIGAIESDVPVFRLPYSEAIGKLSGTQLLDLDWMFED